MDIEVKIEKNCTFPKIVIYAKEINKNISDLIDNISNITNRKLNAYKNNQLYILEQREIETIYSENGKIYVRYNNEIYFVKNRLYELENLLDKTMFLRISNSEIVNFNKIENIDLKLIGTIILNFKSGNKSYASRRYIPKIKKFLEI